MAYAIFFFAFSACGVPEDTPPDGVTEYTHPPPAAPEKAAAGHPWGRTPPQWAEFST